VSDTTLDRARAVADAVLYEGYLLYPYRASATKNQVRWQFGVLGPPGAAAAGVGEEADLAVQCLVRPRTDAAAVRVHLRFLHLQERAVQRRDGPDAYTPVPELAVAGRTWVRWDEAVERELTLGPCELAAGTVREDPVEVPGGADVELLRDGHGAIAGRLVRRRQPLTASVSVAVRPAGPVAPDGRPLMRLAIGVRNTTAAAATDRDAATARSFLGAHLILVADGASFVSVIDPPPWATGAAAACEQRRCWPVLAGGGTDVVLASPIILYDQPELAPESAGALFDSTEIDEILTLRIMTLTDEEKAAARATDPHAAAIIDRCDSLTPAELQRLHGILRDPRAGGGAFAPIEPDSDDVRGVGAQCPPAPAPIEPDASTVPWWDPGADASVDPASDAVVVDGVEVRRGSLVRLRPSRRADAQDMFVTGQLARVATVVSDVDGGSHVGVVLADDPAADLHEWYGRYLYFAPDEVEPMKGR
jgi:hypothetical protein